MNPDWDGTMKARAREPKPPAVRWYTDDAENARLRARVAELEGTLDRFSDAVTELLRVGPFAPHQQANIAAVRAEFEWVNAALRSGRA